MPLPRMASRITEKASWPSRRVRDDIIKGVEEALIDLGAGHEAIDLDHMGALDLNRLQFLLRDHQVLALGDLIAAPFVFGRNRLAGFLIDKLLAQAIAG